MTLNEHEKQLSTFFDDAMKFRDAGSLQAAAEKLEHLLTLLNPDDRLLLTHTHMQLGNIRNKQGDPASVEQHFRKAVAVAPHHEFASLGLFHALVHLDRWEEAMAEMIRYVTSSDSAEYRALLDGYGPGLPPNLLRLADEARRLLASHNAR